ncbi:mitochondrial cysteine desulfurase, partial [Acrasis kona]
MAPFLTSFFGNPSSSHFYGTQVKKVLEESRRKVAELLKCDSDEIIFTSGGSESNNYAIKGCALELLKTQGRNHIITTCIEHPAVIEVYKYL